MLIAGATSLAATPAQARHASGLEILPALDVAAIMASPELPRIVHRALQAAWDLAEREPAAYGYPYVNSSRTAVVLTPTTAAAEARARDWRPGVSVSTEIKRVTRAYGQLEAIRHEAIGPGVIGLPDSSLIWMTTTDEGGNRVLVVVSRISDALLFALARRYGTEAIAIRVEANPNFTQVGRQDDESPFWGGARIDIRKSNKECTSGFAAIWNGYYRMLTAGHCARTGGYVNSHKNPDIYQMGTWPMGWIYENGAFENWNSGVGTVAVNGRYDGDLALITMDSGLSSAARIYVGPSNSSSSQIVSPTVEYCPSAGG